MTAVVGGTASDWWYVRAYPGRACHMDAATRLLVPWLQDQARQAGADRWFFLRYLDMTGQHLRLRVRCPDDAADRLHARLPEVVERLQELDGTGPAERLLPGADFGSAAGRCRVTAGLYAPELGKYGGAQGVAIAEELFTRSSSWYAAHDVGGLRPVFDRAGMAVAYLRQALETALPAGEHEAFWAAHRRQWGVYLRMALPTSAAFSGRLSEVAHGVATCRTPAAPGLDVGDRTADLVTTLDRAEALPLPVPRAELLCTMCTWTSTAGASCRRRSACWVSSRRGPVPRPPRPPREAADGHRQRGSAVHRGRPDLCRSARRRRRGGRREPRHRRRGGVQPARAQRRASTPRSSSSRASKSCCGSGPASTRRPTARTP